MSSKQEEFDDLVGLLKLLAEMESVTFNDPRNAV